MNNNKEFKVDEYINLIGDLVGEKCQLNHGPKDTDPHEAINTVCIRLGKSDKDNPDIINCDGCLTIPICQDCVDGLTDPNWVLVYCLECHSSQWIYKPLAKMTYPPNKDIIWVGDCPKCENTGKSGMWFTGEQW